MEGLALADDATILRRRLRPRDAATLIVVDESGAQPRLLLGRRASGHVFMAGKYVFPGGRIDPSDLRLAAGRCLPEPMIARLLAGTPERFDARRATALALAAIRETFEETGAMIGLATPPAPSYPAGIWQRFAAAGIHPDPSRLVPVARALTPPGHVRRYDTRFFCVGAGEIAATSRFEDRPDRELDTAGWFTLDEVARLDLPGITRQVLSDIDDRLRDGSWRQSTPSMPFYRQRHGRRVRDMI